MPSEVLYTPEITTEHCKSHSSNNILNSIHSSSPGSSFLKKLLKEKKPPVKQSEISITDHDDTCSNSPSPNRTRRRFYSISGVGNNVNNNNLQQQSAKHLRQHSDSASLKVTDNKSRSPSPSLLLRRSWSLRLPGIKLATKSTEDLTRTPSPQSPRSPKSLGSPTLTVADCPFTRSPSPTSFRKSLSRRLSGNSSEKSPEELLHHYVKNNDLHALEKLLAETQEVLNLNTTVAPGVTALHEACALGHMKIIKLLIKYGADVHFKTRSDLSPVKVAVLSGSYEIAQYLISIGADPDDIKDGFQIDETSRRCRSV